MNALRIIFIQITLTHVIWNIKQTYIHSFCRPRMKHKQVQVNDLGNKAWEQMLLQCWIFFIRTGERAACYIKKKESNEWDKIIYMPHTQALFHCYLTNNIKLWTIRFKKKIYLVCLLYRNFLPVLWSWYKALFKFKVQNSKKFVNRLYGVLNVVEKKLHYTNRL